MIGFHTTILPEEGYDKCPEFWDREYNEKYAHLWQTMIPENDVERAMLNHGIGMYAVCTDGSGSCEYWIAGMFRGGDVPEGLELLEMADGDWAVFTAKGPLPGSLQGLNTRIRDEWYPNDGRVLGADLNRTVEEYSAMDPSSPDYECAIWIPLSGKKEL